jgi:site-specific recombinase XerD
VKELTNDLIGEWCEHHHNLNNISHDRRVEQLRVLRQLEATLPGPVTAVEARDLERYMAQMIRDGYHPHTVVKQVALIRPFLRWMWNEQLLGAEQWLRLKEVRTPRGAYDGKPRPYTRTEIRHFWNELEQRYPWTLDRERHFRTAARGEHWVRRWAEGTASYRRVRPYAARLQIEAIVALALYAGLRRDEIYRIGLEDMHYHNEYVRVASRKGPDAIEKVRVVPMNEAIMLAAGNWVEFRAQVLAPEHDFPWLTLWAGTGSNNCKPMSKMHHTQFASLLRKVGSGWEYHRLRHTFATERYRAGMPIEILQPTLGHASYQQTLGYAQISEDRIIAASHASDRSFLKALRRNPNANQEVA